MIVWCSWVPCVSFMTNTLVLFSIFMIIFFVSTILYSVYIKCVFKFSSLFTDWGNQLHSFLFHVMGCYCNYIVNICNHLVDTFNSLLHLFRVKKVYWIFRYFFPLSASSCQIYWKKYVLRGFGIFKSKIM